MANIAKDLRGRVATLNIFNTLKSALDALFTLVQLQAY